MSDLTLLLIPLLPLAAFLLLGLLGSSKGILYKYAGYIGTVFMLLACLFSVQTAYSYFSSHTGSFLPETPIKFTWLSFGQGFSIDMGVTVDPISSMMLVVVTFVSLMVHVFSLWYMKGEQRYGIYYAFLGLFTFSMLGLVLSSNLFQIYIFWELVGVSSFLLIGYYYDRISAVAAAKKAFIVTRFADFGFLLGILTLGYYTRTFDFGEIISRLTNHESPYYMAITAAGFMGVSTLTWGLLLVFMGGAGKSAMFPLHIWLPDAMEGPTPVSALIHAATMVVAGVFLVARLFPVFALSCPDALQVVAYTGIISAVFAALIACTQTDIKRVLAYSTMSQIGYMMFSLGISGYGGEAGAGYSASLFHLFTHAFFKSLMFLGAGAVIHYVHSNEMNDMGGLRKHLPVTHFSFLIGCLAISGIVPFSGFFSKEAILHAAHAANPVIYYLALGTSLLTAFYMFRLYFSVFWNKEYHGHHSEGEDHNEGNIWMKIPLILLSIAALGAGLIPFSMYVSTDGVPLASHTDFMFSILPLALAGFGIGLASKMYGKSSSLPDRVAASLGAVYTSAKNKFYVDEFYLFITRKVIFNLVGRPAAWIDKNIVEGFYYLMALITADFSESVKGLQSGRVQGYALYFTGGAFGLMVLILYVLN